MERDHLDWFREVDARFRLGVVLFVWRYLPLHAYSELSSCIILE